MQYLGGRYLKKVLYYNSSETVALFLGHISMPYKQCFCPWIICLRLNTLKSRIEVHVPLINFWLLFRPVRAYSILYVYYFFILFPTCTNCFKHFQTCTISISKHCVWKTFIMKGCESWYIQHLVHLLKYRSNPINCLFHNYKVW